MVRTLARRLSMSKSFRFKKMFEGSSGRQVQKLPSANNRNEGDASPRTQIGFPLPLDHAAPASRLDSLGSKQSSDIDLLKERFAKLLLGEDMSGGGKGVSSALALSNAITNLAASIFGEQTKLQPMSGESKARWRKEIDWLLSVTDHIVELVPSQQETKDGGFTEIMVTKQRADLQMNIPALRKLDALLLNYLDNFGDPNEFWYVSRDSEESKDGLNQRNDNKWWLPAVKVPPNGLSEATRRWLHYQKDGVTQVLKAVMAINAQVLSEMEIPESYIESLPKNGKTSLGDGIYRSITEEHFDPDSFLSALDLSTELKVLDLKNRIEASIVIWKRKMNQKDGKSTWASTVSLEKRELFEERVETILIFLKQRFPGIPQSELDISKIQYNKDVGQALLESYSRILESLAFNITSRIEDVLYADSVAQKALKGESDGKSETEAEALKSSDAGDITEKLISSETPNSKKLSDFFGWNTEPSMKKCCLISDLELKEQRALKSPRKGTPKKLSYLQKLETLSSLRCPTERD